MSELIWCEEYKGYDGEGCVLESGHAGFHESRQVATAKGRSPIKPAAQPQSPAQGEAHKTISPDMDEYEKRPAIGLSGSGVAKPLQSPSQTNEAQALLTWDEMSELTSEHTSEAFSDYESLTWGIAKAQLAKATPIIEQRVLDAVKAELDSYDGWQRYVDWAEVVHTVRQLLATPQAKGEQ